MSGRGDDKSIEPAHQPWPAAPAWDPGSTIRPLPDALTEDRVRRIAEEAVASEVAALKSRINKIEVLLEPGWLARDVDRAAERLKQWAPSNAAPPAPPRETGWAVVDKGGGALQFSDDDGVRRVRWFDSRAEAATLSQMLGVGRAAELYKDTLEEVEA